MNVIPDRIHRFLKGFMPFSLLDDTTLHQLAATAIVRHVPEGAYVFKEGEPPLEHIFVVREGAIQLLQQEGELLIEECDEGDLFGLRPLLAGQPYVLSAKAIEESLVYALRVDNLQKMIETNPKVGFYLAQHFALGISGKYNKMYKNKAIPEATASEMPSLHELQSVRHSKEPVTCSPTHTIQEAARLMQAKRVGSVVIVDAANCPVGIITDKDLRNRVVTGEVSRKQPVTDIMSSPVVTLKAEKTVADVQISMMKHRIHHLCITEDGTPATPIQGVISEHDLLVLQGNNPAILIREMQRSRDTTELAAIRARGEALLAQYLEREVAIDFIASVMTEINDSLISRVITLSISELEAAGTTLPNVPWCWMGLGSEGRGEQLLRTDQDNALVFGDVPAAEMADVKARFLALAQVVTDKLNACGFEYCPADMMASNPKWCLSLSGWKEQFAEWILSPTNEHILHCTIFFDYRPLYGDESLTVALSEHIFDLIDKQQTFLSLLAKNALENPPPLTFFRHFVVEKNGEHKDAFNIKARAMMPLTDAARVLVMSHKVGKINNTFERFERLAALEPTHASLFQQAADAYEMLMRYRAIQGLKNGDSGKFLHPSELSKMERLNLRNSFKPIHDLQEILEVRFQLSYFR
ncbi:MAG: DUF294 nucleotidyltransferase-like domain-containing protein [Saprospiraceae bacterium]